ncbi:MAG: hypothetical protein ABIH09_02720, partial [Candidatus Omnitrophota bacterium]
MGRKLKKHMIDLTKWMLLISFFVSFNLNAAEASGEADSLFSEFSEAREGGKYAQLDVGTFSIPAHLGEILYSYQGESNKFVIHLQDAHCNYFAQHKIADILDYLNKEYGLSIVNLEGGVKEYDLRAFTSITGKDIRREVADYFVKKGEINGAEFYAINNPEKVTLWGVEDKDLYLKNLQVYRDSLKYKDQVDGFLKVLSYILNNLKRGIYSQELLKIDMAYNAYKSGNMDFRDYLEFLIGKAREKNIEVKNFSNIYLLFQAMETENDIDFKRANLERSMVLDELRNKLSKNDIHELVLRTVDFKTKKLSRKSFYSFLLKKARQINLDIKRFPALSEYIMYVSFYEAVDRSKVMEELDRLESEIKEPLYRNNIQRLLNVLSRNLVLMRNIFNVLLTKVDYSYYLSNKRSFEIKEYQEFIDNEAPLYKIDTRPDSNISKLDDYREQITKFYEYSFERDEVFLENLRFVSAEGNLETSVLMTGGFHTENLCELFKKAGISYVSIMPKFVMKDGYENPYFDILAGQTTDVQRMLTSVIAKTSMMQVASMATELAVEVWGKSGVEAFYSDVELKRILTEWQKLKPDGCEIIIKDKDKVLFKLREGARPEQSPLEIDIALIIENAQDMFIDPVIEDVMKGRKGSYEPLEKVYPSAKKKAIAFFESKALELKDLGRIKASEELEKVALGLSEVPQLMLLSGVKGFKGHAGGRGIFINADAAADENDVIGVLIHEAIAGYAHYHIVGYLAEQLFHGTGNVKITDFEQLEKPDVMRDKPVWTLAKEDRWKGRRDIAAAEENIFTFGTLDQAYSTRKLLSGEVLLAWQALKEIEQELKKEFPGEDQAIEDAMKKVGFMGGFVRALWYNGRYVADLDVFLPGEKYDDRIVELLRDKTDMIVDKVGANMQLNEDASGIDELGFTINKLAVFYDGSIVEFNEKTIQD